MPFSDMNLAAPERILVFVLVMTRIAGLMMTAPVLGMRTTPTRVRVIAVFAMALIIGPIHWHSSVSVPNSLLEMAIMVAGEALIGLALGLGVQILFSGIQLTGQVIGQMSGAQIADVFDPTFDQSVPLYSQLLDWVMLSLFVLIGGHRQVMDALLSTFQHLPIGGGTFQQELSHAMIDILTQSFTLGLRAAAPAMVALMMSVLILGLISRTLPQLNILAVGFSLNAMVMLAVVGVSIGGMVMVFQDSLQPTIDAVYDSVVPNREPLTSNLPS